MVEKCEKRVKIKKIRARYRPILIATIQKDLNKTTWLESDLTELEQNKSISIGYSLIKNKNKNTFISGFYLSVPERNKKKLVLIKIIQNLFMKDELKRSKIRLFLLHLLHHCRMLKAKKQKS